MLQGPVLLTAAVLLGVGSYTTEQLREIFLSSGFQLEAVMILAQIQQDLVGTVLLACKTCTKVQISLLGILMSLRNPNSLPNSLCVSNSSLRSCKPESGCF